MHYLCLFVLYMLFLVIYHLIATHSCMNYDNRRQDIFPQRFYYPLEKKKMKLFFKTSVFLSSLVGTIQLSF